MGHRRLFRVDRQLVRDAGDWKVAELLHRFIAAYVQYIVHVYAYVFLIANPFPGFVGAPGTYPIEVEIDGPERQHRLKTLARLFLALPAFLISGTLNGVLFFVAFFGWFVGLFLGRMPLGFRNVGAWPFAMAPRRTRISFS